MNARTRLLHGLLQRQLRRFFGSTDAIPEALAGFVSALDEAYRSFDEDRRMLERALELSSTELLRSNADMRAVFHAFPDLFFRLSADGVILDVRGGEADLVMPPRDYLGKRFDRLPAVGVPHAITEALRRVRETGARVRVEYPLIIQGKESFFEARFVPFLDRQFIAIVRNISEQRRSTLELASQRAFLRSVIDLDPNLVFAKDRAGRFTLVNQAVADAYGSSVEALIGKTDADFNQNREEVARFRRDDLEVLDTGRDKAIPEEPLTDSSGKVRWLQTFKRAIVSPDGSVDQVLGVATDITAHKALQEQLVQSQKIEAIGALAGGIAHDFNNLLTVIVGYTDLLLARLDTHDPLRASALEIRTAGERASSLTRQLLAFSRKQRLEPRIVDVAKLVDGLCGMLGRLIGENVHLAIEGSALRRVKADPGQLEQVLVNLVVNARDAMPEGGRITISLSDTVLDRGFQASHPGSTVGPHVAIRVADTGCGMSEATLARVFEPFFTTKEVGKGTGLGLATVYGIVKQSGGYIEVSSRPGFGSAFIVYLPATDEVADEAVQQAPTGIARPARETILLVEDEDQLRELTACILEQEGYFVLRARHPGEALLICERHAETIHALLTDMVMPHMCGTELRNRLLRIRPEMRVLLMSGYTDVPVRAAPGEAEPSFLHKPFSAEVLKRKLREVLDHGLAQSPVR